jgi:predicted TIM-barrel fold metal-dependent hydrolase
LRNARRPTAGCAGGGAATVPTKRSELRWAKEHGACGIFKRGFDLDRYVTDPHFFPVYEEASALDLPLCIHTGHPLPGHEWDRGFPIMYSRLARRSPKKFPKLRFYHRVGGLVIPIRPQLGR